MSLCNGCLGCSFCNGGDDYPPHHPTIKMGDKPTMTHTIMGEASCNIIYRYYDGDEFLYDAAEEYAAWEWLSSREGIMLPTVDAKLHIRTGKVSIIENAGEYASQDLRKFAKRVTAKHNRRINKALLREAA